VLTESARMTSAAEARFRIDRPNSRPRAVKVVALDRHAEPLVASLADESWHGATFHTFVDSSDLPAPLAQDLDIADHVVVVTTAGQRAAGAAAIGAACSRRRISTTGLVLGSDDVPDEVLARTLADLRPWMLMLVLANSDEYVGDMLRALRA
jgi:hypothetical protein